MTNNARDKVKGSPIILVQGAQWGSEAKGTIAAYLCIQRDIQYAVRTGGVNAGHTVLFRGKTHKMQQLPTGWVNPNTRLVLAAGAYIDPEILAAEVALVDSVMGAGTTAPRLFIDVHAGLHSVIHASEASMAGRHVRIGATGKGVSEAIIDKIRNRGNGARLFMDVVNLMNKDYGWIEGVNFVDTSHLLNNSYNRGARILIEGTQGHHLDLHYGPWPYTTGKQTVAATWLAECGLSPRLEYEIVSVVRTFPIRVAGNSGPMPFETSWPKLARDINSKLTQRGMDERIKESSIKAFEDAVAKVSQTYSVPSKSDGLDQHTWTTGERDEHRQALSSINASAITLLQNFYPSAYSDICRLFEFTTVTRKLRRIAGMSYGDLQTSCLRDRPSWLAVTFLNYEYPHLWDGSSSEMHHYWNREIHEYLRRMATVTNTPVGLVSLGPELGHVVDIHVDQEGVANL